MRRLLTALSSLVIGLTGVVLVAPGAAAATTLAFAVTGGPAPTATVVGTSSGDIGISSKPFRVVR